jgi:hypothetical protein
MPILYLVEWLLNRFVMDAEANRILFTMTCFVCVCPCLYFGISRFARHQRRYCVLQKREYLQNMKDTLMQPVYDYCRLHESDTDQNKKENETGKTCLSTSDHTAKGGAAAKDEEENECRICCSKPINVTYNGCGHSFYCAWCFQRLIDGIFLEKQVDMVWNTLHSNTIETAKNIIYLRTKNTRSLMMDEYARDECNALEFLHVCEYCGLGVPECTVK